MRVLLLGYVVRGPIGGFAWSSLQYLIGLMKLGHDVYFLEDSGDDDECCYDPETSEMTKDPSFGLRYAEEIFAGSGMEQRWAYYDAHRRQWLGPCAGSTRDIWRTADALLNLSGCNSLREWSMEVPIRAFIDMDPVFTQIRHLTEPEAMDQARRHTAFLTFAENIGQPECGIPNDGLPWMTTRHPVVVDRVPIAPKGDGGNFSTVMQWQSYPDRTYGGATYGNKSESFTPYLDLPKRVKAPLELALGGDPAPRHLLKKNGWLITDPYEASRTPKAYLAFMRRSKAEFTVAKHAYVATSSGWFSERTAAYLASGRPAVTQETGFSRWLDADVGVMSFRSPDEAIAAIEEVCGNYARHAGSAREIAAEHFEAGATLTGLLAKLQAAKATNGVRTNGGARAPVAQMDRAGDS